MDYKVNTQYKDRLFCFLFGNEKYKKHALSLYNALNNVNYENEDELEIMTLKDVIYIRMRNDVAVMISGTLELWEHQSTVNPNMPIRGLMYFARLYERYIVTGHHNLYRNTLIMLPTPKYIVFYNGKEERPAVEKLRLSRAFCNADPSGDFEWTATVMNLNHGDNAKMLGKCELLQEYTGFVEDIRKYSKEMDEAGAVDLAVTECIRQGGELAGILLEHRAEVVDMLLTEFDEEAFVRDIREEGRQEGIREGIREGRQEGMREGIREGMREGLQSLVATLQKFIKSPQELYQTVISNDCYKDLTFEELQKITESLEKKYFTAE